jgi:hypothetical protein
VSTLSPGSFYTAQVFAKIISISGEVIDGAKGGGCTLDIRIGRNDIDGENLMVIEEFYAPTNFAPYEISEVVNNNQGPLDYFVLRWYCGVGINGIIVLDQVPLVLQG